MDQTKELIQRYLSEASLLGLCTTSSEGAPWASTVYFAFDEIPNLYFISKVSRRHSVEIKENPRAAALVCKAHQSPFEMPCRGLQLEGRVTRLDDAHSAMFGFDLYMKRFPHSKRLHESVADVTGSAERRVYRFEPSRIVLFDEENYPQHPQQEVVINK